MAAMLKLPAWMFTTGVQQFGGGGLSNNEAPSVVTLRKREYSGIWIEAVPAGREAAAPSFTLYEVLGVEVEGSSAADIKRAYKELARRFHPDTNRQEDLEACTQKFLEVRNAYEVLSDPSKKAEYDFSIANPMLAQAYGNSSWSRGNPRRGGSSFDPWEAQLSRFTCSARSNRRGSSQKKSWGAMMREKKNRKQADSL